MSKKISILYSGGLDSVMLSHYAFSQGHTDIVKVYYDHGQPAAKEEIASLPKDVHVRKLDWLNLPIPGTLRSKPDDKHRGNTYIPGRNLVFSILTACQDIPDEIWMGTQFEESHGTATDRNAIFRQTAGAAASYALSPWNPNIIIRAPFAELGWKKIDSIRWALGVMGEQAIKDCVSCYAPMNKMYCGECSQCVRRFTLFGALGFDELEKLKIHPLVNPNTQGRKWLIGVIKKLDEIGWQGPLMDEFPLQWLANYIKTKTTMFQNDSELLECARLIETGLRGEQKCLIK